MSDEDVGSVGEEAAKLFEALQGWAQQSAQQSAHERSRQSGQPCTSCPLCQAITLVRQSSPEVRTHLAVAASSLLHAAAGLLETRVAPDRTTTGVERIDLDDDPSDDPSAAPWDAE